MSQKIIIYDHDHLAICLKHYATLFIKEKNGELSLSSKFKLKERKHTIYDILGKGEFTIDFQGKIFKIVITEVGDPLVCDIEIKIHKVIEVYYDDRETLDLFLEKACKYYIDNILDNIKEKNKTTIYVWEEGYWETMEKRKMRSLSTIYLAGKEMEIFEKIKHFTSSETESLYNSLGIPYKMNMLFHGYPGTGKTSLIYSLASELNMDVALVHFTREMNDLDFMRAMRRLPSNTILILEDIDVLFECRKKNDENKSAISFSGLLNCLDGIAHSDKQIIIMTTNCKMVLDKALTRPGRIDLELEFKYSCKQQVEAMFKRFLPNQVDKFKEFYKAVKSLNLTTAILQQYLFSNIKCENILDTINELEEICMNNNYDEGKETLYT
tara:strand:+ start:663 stop:1808 length:1146 start_codon:yes stop_codon:yes gene_type:complete